MILGEDPKHVQLTFEPVVFRRLKASCLAYIWYSDVLSMVKSIGSLEHTAISMIAYSAFSI